MRKLLLSLTAALLLFFTSFAQTVTVSGKVTDENGNPIPSASVTVKGATSGVSTDAQGNFSISIAKGATLIISAIGYDDASVVAHGDALTVKLSIGTRSLSEVVVTGYGGTQIKKDVTGNIARVKGKDIEYMPTPTVDQALQGKAAGVFVNSMSGKLGQAVTVRVRGNSSISASSQPLFVVDGVPITSGDLSSYGGATNTLADINPNDIESIEILKDASAGAIYGSRAANGVVLITTKRGKTGKTNVSVNFQTGISEATRRVDMLNSEQYAEMILEGAAYNDVQDGYDPSDPDSWTTYVKDGILDYYSYGQWSQNPSKTYNWQDHFFQKGSYNQADVQLRGGNDRTKFFASFQHLDQNGIMLGNKLIRTTGRLNLDQKVNNWLDIGMSMALSRTYNRRLPGDNAFSNPMQSAALMPMTPFIDPNTGLDAGTPPGDVGIPLYYNPMLSVNYAKFSQEIYRTLGNAYARVRLMQGLTFNSEFGLDYLSQNEEGYWGSQTVRNNSSATNGDGQNTGTFVSNFNLNNYFNYNKVFGKHNIDAVLGMQYQESSNKYNSVSGMEYPSNSYQKIASAADVYAGTSTQTDFRFLSYFLRANYVFNEKYLLSGSVRVDQSSRFGRNSRTGTFPAVSAGWILTNEDFLSDAKFLSFLKLRASYGIVGNAEIGNFPQMGLFSGDAGYAGTSGQRPSQLANPDLKWETTKQLDFGIDFGFFNNRLTGEIDYYEKKTDGLLLNVNVPATSGFQTITRNVGKLQNKGWEFVLNSQNFVGAFKWSTNFNIAFNKGRVNNILGQVITGGVSGMNRVMEGEAVGVFFAPEYAGVDPANGDALFFKNIKGTNGELDRTTTNNYNEAQRVVIGDPNPDAIWGFTNNFSYKGFDLSIFFNGVWGNQINIYGMGRYSSANMLYEDNNTVDQLARWQKPGDITNVPQVRLYTINGSQASSRYMTKGDYARLRTLTLGYNFTPKIVKALRMDKLRVYASAYNLLTITQYPYWDPEVNADDFDSNIAKGNDFYTAPQPRTFLFGINVTF